MFIPAINLEGELIDRNFKKFHYSYNKNNYYTCGKVI